MRLHGRVVMASAGALATVLLSAGGAHAGLASRSSLELGRTAAGVTRPARGRFLVANHSLTDPSFAETVVLLVDYDEDGALGVVLNRPTEVPLTTALPEVKELRRRKDFVFLGGPVARDRMVLLLHADDTPPESIQVFDGVYATGSLVALRKSIDENEPVRAYAGYAGWGPGQLDAEVARGDWLIGPADSKAIFEEPPNDLWSRLVERFAGDWAGLDVDTVVAAVN